MAVEISTALRNQIRGGTFRGAAGINWNGGAIQIRSGAQGGGDGPATGSLLVSIPLNASTGFLDAAVGAVSGNLPTGTAATGTGTAAHFRILQTGDTGVSGTTNERIEGSVGTTGSDINLDSTSITAGQTVTLTSLTVTMPAS